MLYGTIPGLDKPVSRLVHGTIMLSEKEEAKSFQLLDDIYSLGVNTFDTAAVYGNGSENVLLKWISERGVHDSTIILSKCAHPNAFRKRVTPFDIQSDIADCMAKPGSDYIDIYMLHRDDPAMDVGPILETLNDLQSRNLIKTFGASNWEYHRIAEAHEYAYKHGLQSFSSISPHFSLGEQVGNPWGDGCVTLTGPVNREARAVYQENQMPIFSYSTLCRGMFSGLFKSNDSDAAKKILDKPAQKGYMYECNFEKLRRVELLAAEKNTTVPCIALAWVLQQPLNVFALIGAEKKSIMQENMEAFNITLTQDELLWLNLDKD